MRRRSLRIALLLALVCAVLAIGEQESQAAGPTPGVTFDLTVSLEWQPGDLDSLPADMDAAGCARTPEERASESLRYLDDLKLGLREAAAFLYEYSDGRMALRNVTIASGGERWRDADIRVLASSAYRPTAFVGGIVATPAFHTVSPTLTIAFHPGAVFLGRLWNGRGARCGAWAAAPGARTIGHEWAHYALYLWDEYLNQGTLEEQYCSNTGSPAGLDLVTLRPDDPAARTAFSVMAYHYRASKLSLWPAGSPPPSCRGTPQMAVYGASDWATIERFYPLSAPRSLTPGPAFEGSPAAELFNVTIVPPAAPRARSSAQVELVAPVARGLEGQAYLIRPGTDGAPQRIVGQGALMADIVLPFLGVQSEAGDRAAVVIQNLVSGERFAFPRDYRAPIAPLSTGTRNRIAAEASVWRPSLTITPVVTQGKNQPFSETTGLTVRMQDCAQKVKLVQLAYCPAGGMCGSLVDVPIDGDGAFTHTFSFPLDGQGDPPAAHGTIYARAPETGEETLAWYQIDGGVGPAHTGGHPPLLDGAVSVDLPHGVSVAGGSDTRVLHTPAQRCTTKGFTLPKGVLGIVGTPLDIQPVIADDLGGRRWGAVPNDPPLAVRLSYDQDLLDRLQIGEERLVILRLDAKLGVWELLPVAGRSEALNWIAAEAQPFGGQGEVYALGYGPAHTLVPMVVAAPKP